MKATTTTIAVGAAAAALTLASAGGALAAHDDNPGTALRAQHRRSQNAGSRCNGTNE